MPVLGPRAERIDLGAGRQRLVITGYDRFYHDGQSWQPVDETIEADGTEGFVLRAERARHRLRGRSDGTYRWYPRRAVPTEFVEVGLPEFWRPQGGGSWRKLSLGTRSQAGNVLAWDSPTYRLEVTFLANVAKAAYILKSNQAPARLRWARTFVGLTRQPDGLLVAASDGAAVARENEYQALDANGNPVAVTVSEAGSFVEVQLDLTGAAFPVTLDPTYDSQPDPTTEEDGAVREDAANANYPDVAEIQVQSTAGVRKHPLMKFDLSSIPAGATLTSATLTLVVLTSRPTALDIKLHRILSANSPFSKYAKWNFQDGASVRWAGDTGSDGGTDAGCSVSGTDYTATELGSFTIASGEAGGTSHDISLSLTELATLIGTNNGFVLMPQSGGPTQYCGIASGDNTTASRRPRLVIEYSTGVTVTPDAVALSLTGPAPTPQLRALPSAPGLTATSPAPTPRLRALPAAPSLALAAPAPTPALHALPPAVSLALTSPAPAVSHGATAAPGVVSLALTAFAPALRLLALPAAASLSLTSPAPSPRLSAQPAAVSLALTAPAPTPRLRALPSAVALSLTGPAPALVLRALPEAIALALAAHAPTIGNATVATPPAVALTLASLAVTPRLRALPAAASAALTAPSPSPSLRALPPAASLSLTAPDPSLRLRALPGAASLGLTALAPAPVVRVLPGVAVLALTMLAPAFQVRALPSSAALVLTVYVVTVTGGTEGVPMRVDVAAYPVYRLEVGAGAVYRTVAAGLAVYRTEVGANPAA